MGSHWNIKPSKVWIDNVVTALGTETPWSTLRVTSRFSEHWFSGVLPLTSITDPQAWVIDDFRCQTGLCQKKVPASSIFICKSISLMQCIFPETSGSTLHSSDAMV